ncbi:MAG: proline dehydrogenase [Gaiellales bacterium]|jgi:proline dehydrogenase|nr:proline dehydrogenase [Gaiellales bacterium]
MQAGPTLFDRAVVRALPAVPRPVVRRLASPYIAGTALEHALATVRGLNARSRMATVDVLGEESSSLDEAHELSDAYRSLLDAIRDEGLDSNVSVKPTGLGLKLDEDACRELHAGLVLAADERSSLVRIDMEDASTTDATLDLYRWLRGQALDRVGIVLQARLRRTLDDVAAVAPLKPNVRVCKGVYLEPPEIAYTGKEEIRNGFADTVDALFAAGCYVAIATHDEEVVKRAKASIAAHGIGRDGYEFQMLLGVRDVLGEQLVREGHRLRVYVPFGSRWYEYSLRRLHENPRLAGAIARSTFGRLVPRRKHR